MTLAPGHGYYRRYEGITPGCSHTARDAAAHEVLWCRKTCLQHTGDIFCQVERLRVQKAGTPMLNWVVRQLVWMSYQDRPLLPLLMAENTFRIKLFHNRPAGPNFRPSRM